MGHNEGKKLNATLAHTARNVLIFSLCTSLFLLFY